MTLQETLEWLYSREINCGLSSFWDGGWEVSIGDKSNGFKTQTMVNALADVGPWLVEQANKFYPVVAE